MNKPLTLETMKDGLKSAGYVTTATTNAAKHSYRLYVFQGFAVVKIVDKASEREAYEAAYRALIPVSKE